ncbi:hypothetical protein LINPERPRIM_LOCUS7877, partial [Linum perenne]
GNKEKEGLSSAAYGSRRPQLQSEHGSFIDSSRLGLLGLTLRKTYTTTKMSLSLSEIHKALKSRNDNVIAGRRALSLCRNGIHGGLSSSPDRIRKEGS